MEEGQPWVEGTGLVGSSRDDEYLIGAARALADSFVVLSSEQYSTSTGVCPVATRRRSITRTWRSLCSGCAAASTITHVCEKNTIATAHKAASFASFIVSATAPPHPPPPPSRQRAYPLRDGFPRSFRPVKAEERRGQAHRWGGRIRPKCTGARRSG